ncbi:MAG: hydrogen peroxide-inducible genes activator, partial [Bacteriovoracia bacterium]
GYTLAPYLATEDFRNRGSIIPFEHPMPAREIGLAMRRKHLKAELVQAFEAQLLQCLPPYLRQLRKQDLDVLPID